MKQFEIEIIDEEIKDLFGIGVGFIEIIKPIEAWMKLPPNVDHRILFRDRTGKEDEMILNEIYTHLIEQFRCFLKEESKNFSIDQESFYDEPIKLGNRSMIKLLYYLEKDDN